MLRQAELKKPHYVKYNVHHNVAKNMESYTKSPCIPQLEEIYINEQEKIQIFSEGGSEWNSLRHMHIH